MFSWSKKKESKRPRSNRDSEENEFGIKLDKGPSDKQLEAELRALAGVDSLSEDDINLNEGEEDEEAELLRLIGGGGKGRKPGKKSTNSVGEIGDITADIPGDLEEGDEDVEVDENDPELLGELLELTQPEDAIEEEPEEESDAEEQEESKGESDIMTVLKERLKLYKTAEAKAKESNESSRARRFSRGIKTLEDLIKKAKAGKAVSPSDIPPEIALNLKPAPPVQPAVPDDETNSHEVEGGNEEPEANEPSANAQPEPVDSLTILVERLKMYQTAETKAKESGETTRARRFSRGIKTIEGLMKQAKAGKQISPADIPPAVALNLKPAPPIPVEVDPGEDEEEKDENELSNVSLVPTSSEELEPKTPEEERNIIDVLSERLSLYKTAEANAKENGDNTRARRFSRGIKTLQDLLKQATAGKPISPDDIPPQIAVNLKPAPPVVRSEEEPRQSAVESDTLVRSSDVPSGPPLKFAPVDDVDLDAELEEEEEVPMTVLEGLEQRLRIYEKLREQALKQGDEAAAEENEHFVRLYRDTIRTYKNGGYIDVENLPAPRGCPPIPIPFQIE